VGFSKYCYRDIVITRGLLMELDYTYWEADDGFFVGYLNSYPDHLTQGHDLAELEEMLADVYQIRQEEEKRLAQKRKSGVLRIKVPA
jgi:predicted RNase H-like HicB family nuclease